MNSDNVNDNVPIHRYGWLNSTFRDNETDKIKDVRVSSMTHLFI